MLTCKMSLESINIMFFFYRALLKTYSQHKRQIKKKGAERVIQGIEQCMACMHVLETVVSCSPLHFWKKKALKMGYFSNRPGPTPGPQLPRPNCSVEALREKETIGLKRKIEGLETTVMKKKLIF